MQRADTAPARCSRPDVLTGKQEGPGEGSLAPDAQCSAHGEDSTVAPLLASGFKRCARRGVVGARRQGQAPAALHAQASQGCQPTNNPDRVLSVEGRPPNGVSQWREPGTQRPGKCANYNAKFPPRLSVRGEPPATGQGHRKLVPGRSWLSRPRARLSAGTYRQRLSAGTYRDRRLANRSRAAHGQMSTTNPHLSESDRGEWWLTSGGFLARTAKAGQGHRNPARHRWKKVRAHLARACGIQAFLGKCAESVVRPIVQSHC